MIKMMSIYFSEDLKCSVKWCLDEALQPQTPAGYILSATAQPCFQDWVNVIIILVIENCNQNLRLLVSFYLERIPKNKQVGTHSFTKW